MPQERPGRPPERPKSRQERPKRTQEPPKLGFRAALTAKWGPLGAQELLEPPWGGFLRSGSEYLHTFQPSGKEFAKTILCAKLMQAYGQHRSTSLCNFSMLLSTATDSRSISIQ